MASEVPPDHVEAPDEEGEIDHPSFGGVGADANEMEMNEMTNAVLEKKFEVFEAYDRKLEATDKKLEAENKFLRLCLVALIREFLRTQLESGSRDRLEDILSRLEDEGEERVAKDSSG